MLIYIIIAILAILLIYFFCLYNSLVKLTNKVDEAFSTMDVYLKKRWDLIPNLVETVKGYANFEKETFENIAKLRSNSYDNLSTADKLKTSDVIQRDIKSIMILSENYPELKASDNFKNLSEELSTVEDEIANSRKYYNAVIKLYNNKLLIFPNNMFAKLFGFKEKNMFEILENEKENISVDI